jgi:hypothetical protein
MKMPSRIKTLEDFGFIYMKKGHPLNIKEDVLFKLKKRN